VPDEVRVDVAVSGEESEIPGPVDLRAYLAMREEIRNAARRSGCSRIGVTLDVRDGRRDGVVVGPSPLGGRSSSDRAMPPVY